MRRRSRTVVLLLFASSLLYVACRDQSPQDLVAPGDASGPTPNAHPRNAAALQAMRNGLSLHSGARFALEPTTSPAIIGNGTVQLGVNLLGHLNVPGGTPSSGSGTPYVGLRYAPTNAEATAPGCLCEGWGVADARSGVTGYANEATGTANLALVEFSADATEARSIVTVGSTFRVTHHYRPSPATARLYEAVVTVENISSSDVDLRYRRVMDWDVEPTPFNEHVTIQGTSTAASVLYTSNNGFETSNPLGSRTNLGLEGDFVDGGPADHGALFDFGFGILPAGESHSFTIYYGAAASENEAMTALGAVGAEVYSLGQTSTDPAGGTPNTFVFAFKGVGGEVQVGHEVTANVTLGGEPVAGVAVTATHIETGDYRTLLTDQDGRVQLTLPDGSYLFHARNIGALREIQGRPLAIAPFPNDQEVLSTPNQNVQRAGVLYDNQATGSWVILTPNDYERLTTSPAVVLTGGTGQRTIELRMQPVGALVDCTILDANGNQVTLDADENLFLILPFRNGAALPPVPPDLRDSQYGQLPRGILLGLATVIAGNPSCSMAGVPSTSGFEALIETNPVSIGGQSKIIIQAIEVTDEEAASGETVPVTMVAEPVRAKLEHIEEPIGDAKGSTDIGWVSYGWGVTDNQVNDRFTTSARFRGLGYYSLYMAYNGTRVRVDAKCGATSCQFYRKSSSSLQVTVSGGVSDGAGTVIFEVTLPGVTTIDFRVQTGSPGADDFAPDSGLRRAQKPTEPENTWLTSGE